MTDQTPSPQSVVVPDPLWMMHVIGPDDIYPAPDHAAAVEWCAYLNREIAPKVPEVLCVAVPAIWTGTAEEHAEGLAEAIKGWTVPAAPAPSSLAGGEALDRFERAAFAKVQNLPRGAAARAEEIARRDAEYDAARNAILAALSPEAPAGEGVAAKPLDWRKPTETTGHETCELIAPGLGGFYGLQRDADHWVVWQADDEYAFWKAETREAAIAKAESDWQRVFAAKALTPRHEAPAEGAGELLPCPFCGGEASERMISPGINTSDDFEAISCGSCGAMISDATPAEWNRRARSSAPEAREDAQPVAWRRALSPIDGHFTYSNVGDDGWQPLYTHPDPDALRVAVETSGFLLDRLEDLEQDVNERDFYGHVHPAASRLRQALAALQAEQGAK